MKINITITTSKIFAFFAVIITAIYDASLLGVVIPVAAGLMANKQYQDRKKCDKNVTK